MADRITRSDRWDWWIVPRAWADAVGYRMPGIVIHRDGRVEVHRSHLPMYAAAGYPVPGDTVTDAPATVRGVELRPWQRRATSWADPRRGSLIVAEPRMGKTAFALTLHDPSTGPLLIFAPLDVRAVWIAWVERVFPGANVLCLEGHEIDIGALRRADVVIAHYDILAWQRVSGVSIGTLIIDEIHLLSNPTSARAKAVRFFAPLARRVISLTGTPLWNHVSGLWPVLAATNPGAWGSTPFHFKQRYCNTPEAPIWMGDLSFKPLGEIRVGDTVMGWSTPRRGGQSKLVKAMVLRVMRHRAPVVRVTLASGTVIRCTADHRWLSGRSHKPDLFITVRPGRKLRRMASPPGPCPAPLDAAYLGGILDGEGTWPKLAQCPRKNPEVYARICQALDRLGFAYAKGADGVRIHGGRDAAVRFVAWSNPAKRGWLERRSLAGRCFYGGADEIVSVEPDGEAEVIGLSTTTRNYCAWGYASENCSPTVTEHGWHYGEISHADEWHARVAEVAFAASWRVERPDLQPTIRRTIPAKVSDEELLVLDEVAAGLRAEGVTDTTIGAISRYRSATGLLKVPTATERALVISADQPVVVWGWHKAVVKAIAAATRAAGRDTFLIHGGRDAKEGGRPMSAAERVRQIDAWRQTARGVLCATLAVGQVGIDLSHASHAVMVQLDWTPAVDYQGEMRTFDPARVMTIDYITVDHPVEVMVTDHVLRKLARAASSAMPAAGSDFSIASDDCDDGDLLAQLDAVLACSTARFDDPVGGSC